MGSCSSRKTSQSPRLVPQQFTEAVDRLDLQGCMLLFMFGAVVPSLSLRHYGKWSLRSSRPGISCGPVLCCFTSLTNKNKGQIPHQAPVRGVLLGRRVHEEEGALFFFTVHTGHIHLIDAFSYIRLIFFICL